MMLSSICSPRGVIGPKSNGTMAWPVLSSAYVGGSSGQVPFGGWPTKGQWFLNDMLARKLHWRLCEGHVGGWPNTGLVGV